MASRSEDSVVQDLLCQLMVSEERYQNVMNATKDSIFINNLDGLFIDVNSAACEALGYTHKEITSMHVWDIEIGFPKEMINQLSLKLTEAPFNVEGRHRRKDGSSFPVDVRMGAFKSMGETMILAIVRDISAEKEAEFTIKKLTSALDHMSCFVLIMGPKGNIEYVNARLLEQTGYSNEEIIGRDLSMLYSDNTNNDTHQMILDQLIYDKAWQGTISLRNKKGDYCRVSAKISSILNEGTNDTRYLVILESS